MKIAVVTGASSGLGREYVRQIAREEDVDEVWAIARRQERLDQLQKTISCPVRTIALDLTKPDSFSHLEGMLQAELPDIRLLVNCAGFGKMGNYAEISLQDSMDMISLNCNALVRMTLTALPYMSRGARILQVSSSSAFQPLPAMNIYAASKAFVHHYSRALRWELFRRNIDVTAVCPYWVKDTGFISTAKNTRNRWAVRHFPLASRARDVVGGSLQHSRMNLPVSTPGIIATFQRLAAKVIPQEATMLFWEIIRGI